jgi:hypothetical protein
MSEVLDKVREKYPQYADVPEDELTLRIGSKYPAYLDSDPAFKTEFQGVVADRSIKAVQSGVSSLIDVLSNPAAGEAAQAGREESSFLRAIGQEGQPPRNALERAARNWEQAGMLTAPSDVSKKPIDIGGTKVMPVEGMGIPTVRTPPEAGMSEKVAAGLYNAGAGAVNFGLSPSGIATMLAPETLPARFIGPVLKGIFAGLMAKEAGQQLGTASVTKDPQDITEGLATAVMAGAITHSAAIDRINDRRAGLGQPPVKPVISNLIKTLTRRAQEKPADVALQNAAKGAEAVAPMTAAAVAQQPAILESAKTSGEKIFEGLMAQEPKQGVVEVKKPQDDLGAVSTPPEAEKPPTEAPENAEQPSSAVPEQLTAASFTHPETGETSTGKNHIEAAKGQNVEAPKIPTERHGDEYGFEVQDPQTGKTRYVSRDESLEIARKSGQLLNEPQRGKLHSDEVWFAIPFEKRTMLKALGLSDADIADLESGKERATDIATKIHGEEDLEAVADKAQQIDEIINEKGKPNALHPESPQLLRTVQPQPGEGAREMPVEGAKPEDGARGGQEAPKPEASKEQRVAQALSSTKRFDRETELNGPDILSWMRDNMKMLSKSAARLKKGREWFRQNKSLYDDSVTLQRAHHNLVYSEKGSTPDVVAQTAYEAGLLKEPSVNELFAKMDKASKARSKAFEVEAREEKFRKEEEEEHVSFSKKNADWLKATEEGVKHLSWNQLKVGDQLEVGGERIEITKLDHDTGDLILEDGRKFGTQKLAEGESIWVEKWEPSPEDEATFAPEPAAPEAEPIKPEAKPEVPKLGAMEKGTGDLLKNVDEEFALVGEKGSDSERIAAEKAKAEKTAAEAREIERKQQGDLLEKREVPEGAKPEPAGAPPEVPKQRGKVRLKNEGPQTYSVIEHLPATEVEIANGEQPVRIKNDKTGKEEVVLESQLQEVRERSPEEKAKGKGMSKKELDDELRRVGLDPSSFKSNREKKEALRREKLKGPGSPSIFQGPDPKTQIEQLTESFQNIKGKKLTARQRAAEEFAGTVRVYKDFKDAIQTPGSISDKVKAVYQVGQDLAKGSDVVSKAVAGLKASGDYVKAAWKGFDNIDDMLREKGELSKALEERGYRVTQFANTVLKNVKSKSERAAVLKWVDAGGSTGDLLWGANHTKPQYRQAYIDAMHLSGDALTAAQNIRNYFEARLQEAIDAGVLEHGVENFIHRIFEHDPEAANKMIGYVQSGILSRNPSLIRKRVFQMDWEAERLGYKPVQDFVPRITHYESSLSKAIAAREFVAKMVGYKDANGVKHAGIKAPDGRPVFAVAGGDRKLTEFDGAPATAHFINPSYLPSFRELTSDEKTELSQLNNKPGPLTQDEINRKAFLKKVSNPENERTDYATDRKYPALQGWKWVANADEGGAVPIWVKGDLAIHPDFVHRVDALLGKSGLRDAERPGLRTAARAVLSVGSTAKQTMLDLSGFHQVQEIVHGIEHGVLPWKIDQKIEFGKPDVDGLLRGGLTIGGDYIMQSEGLMGRSISKHIPYLGGFLEWYHNYLFKDFIPRLKMTMATHALERNVQRYKNELASGEVSMEDLYHKTANQANGAFGGQNRIVLENSKTMQDLRSIIMFAPDFLISRAKFVGQAFQPGAGDIRTAEYWKRGGPLTSNEQRQALLLGASVMYALARIGNQILNGQPHLEPENAFSIIYKGKAYGLRTVQGDVLHMLSNERQFWMSRVNPILVRPIIEMATGRDYFGRKRSWMEQIWDDVTTLTPITLRSSRERSLVESLWNGFGVTARRYADTDQAYKMAQKWKDKHGIQEKGEFIYDSDKDPLRPLKLALANGDEAGAVKEIKRLKDAKWHADKKGNTNFHLNEYWRKYSTSPFAGGVDNEKEFIKTLTADQKKTVESAKQSKKAMFKLFLRAKAQMASQPEDKEELSRPEPVAQ